MVVKCTHECHSAGMALCIDCQDDPSHEDEPKFEYDPEDLTQTEFTVPPEDQP